MGRALILVNLISLCAITACSSNDVKKEKEAEIDIGKIVSYRYIPILPMPVPKGLKDAKGEEFKWSKNAEALSLLENEALRASLGRKESSGLLSYGVANSDASISSGLYTLDSVRYTAIPYLLPSYDEICGNMEKAKSCDYDKWTSRIAFLLVGVGARAEITFSSKSRSFDATSILTFSAEASDVEGRINLSSIGVTSASISPLLSVSPNLSTDNIESTLKSLEAVKMIATFSGDSAEVKVNPQILAVDPGDMPMNALLEDIYQIIIRPRVYEERLSKSGFIE